MQFDKTPIKDLLVIKPRVFKDARGYFMESYNHKSWNEILKTDFVQDNESLSQKGVLRGLHFQKPPYAQAKLVRVIKGSVLDVAVDLRKSSPTFGKYYKIILSEENKKQLFIPKGFAHGFLCLEDGTVFAYKCSAYYNSQSERVLAWDDKLINIDWNIEKPLVSDRDALAMSFKTFKTPFI
jgi:dTDP-4-dehydrorhamnose 3,5-epimerase